jgi:hypothetical protein
MKFITLTRTERNVTLKYFIAVDKIHFIRSKPEITWVNFGTDENETWVDQTPEEIMRLINGDNT